MNEKFKVGIFFLCFFVLFFLVKRNMNRIEKEIKDNKIESVCKTVRHSSNRTQYFIYYIYNFNGKQYESVEILKNSGESYLNKFYKLNISSINPEHSKIILDNEITDTLMIKEAGF